MRVTATFSDGLRRQLDGMAIGDEFEVTARARVIAAEEVLIDVTPYGQTDPHYLQGDLEVRLLLSRAQAQAGAEDPAKPAKEKELSA
jgi:hypothetical protein